MNKVQAQDELNKATTKMDLYTIAGKLNNLPEHIHQDKVTFLGFMDFDEAKQNVQLMINCSKSLK